MEIGNKAWLNVKESTIRNCFKTLRIFQKKQTKKTDLHDVREESETISAVAVNVRRVCLSFHCHDIGGMSFEDFIHFKNSLTSSGILADAKIIA